ncbi:MAG: hypothetical protein U0X91_05705 [Spirosomataceae bacterium]
MKPSTFFLLFSILCIVLLNGCTPKSAEPEGPFLSCKIDGIDYSVTGAYSYATTFSDRIGIYGVREVSSNKTDSRTFYIILAKDKGVGKHTLTEGGKDHGNWIVGSGTTDNEKFFTYNKGGGGYVEITRLTATEAEGTFAFTAATFKGDKKVTVSDGKFRVVFR